jgi:hypothetical protein
MSHGNRVVTTLDDAMHNERIQIRLTSGHGGRFRDDPRGKFAIPPAFRVRSKLRRVRESHRIKVHATK